MNKKGMIGDMLGQWLVRIGLTTVVVIAMIFIIRSVVGSVFVANEAEMNLFIYRSLLSQNGISYYDQEIDRVRPFIIEDFDIINDSIYYGLENRRISAKFEILDLEGNSVREFFYNEKKYKIWNIINKLLWKGPGGVDNAHKKFYVTYQGNEAILEIKVLTSR